MIDTNKLVPLHDQCLVRRLDVEKVTKGGLHIPQTGQHEHGLQRGRGHVIAIGPGRFDKHGKREPMDVKVGDEVIFSRLSGAETRQLDDDLVFIEERQIMVIVDPNDDGEGQS